MGGRLIDNRSYNDLLQSLYISYLAEKLSFIILWRYLKDINYESIKNEDLLIGPI